MCVVLNTGNHSLLQLSGLLVDVLNQRFHLSQIGFPGFARSQNTNLSIGRLHIYQAFIGCSGNCRSMRIRHTTRSFRLYWCLISEKKYLLYKQNWSVQHKNGQVQWNRCLYGLPFHSHATMFRSVVYFGKISKNHEWISASGTSHCHSVFYPLLVLVIYRAVFHIGSLHGTAIQGTKGVKSSTLWVLQVSPRHGTTGIRVDGNAVTKI